MVAFAGDHLGRSVARRATSRLQLLILIGIIHVAETEVNDLQRLVEVEQ